MSKQRPKVYRKYTVVPKRLNQMEEGEDKKHYLPSLRTQPIDKAKKRSRAQIYRQLRPKPQITNKRVFHPLDQKLNISKANMLLSFQTVQKIHNGATFQDFLRTLRIKNPCHPRSISLTEEKRTQDTAKRVKSCCQRILVFAQWRKKCN